MPAPQGVSLAAYAEALLARFQNPAIRHRTWQIAMDGSQKLPQRLLGAIRDRLQAGAPIDVVVPKSTIFSEHPAVIIDRNVTATERPIVQAFLNFLWSDEAQKAFVKYHFRSVTNESFNEANKEFAKIEQPFTIEMFGGWTKAYPEIIEGVFRDQVQRK